MTAYRFCRTDDVPLLVRAHNACCALDPSTPPITVDDFRRWMRELDVWCSSCMVALEGSDPVGVLIAAKRAHASYIHRVGVRPEHRRRGHARHMLESLARKMSILEPRLLLAEVPQECGAAMRLLEACGYASGEILVDHGAAPLVEDTHGDAARRFQRPSRVTWPDLEGSGALASIEARTWLRTVEGLRAVRNELQGLAVVSDLRIEAWLLYRDLDRNPDRDLAEPPERLVLALGSASGTADESALRALLLAARADSRTPVRIPRLHPREVAPATLGGAGFAPAAAFSTFSAEAAAG